jgi:hypothetical protein
LTAYIKCTPFAPKIKIDVKKLKHFSFLEKINEPYHCPWPEPYVVIVSTNSRQFNSINELKAV